MSRNNSKLMVMPSIQSGSKSLTSSIQELSKDSQDHERSIKDLVAAVNEIEQKLSVMNTIIKELDDDITQVLANHAEAIKKLESVLVESAVLDKNK